MAKKKTVIERKPIKIKKTRKISEEHKEKLRTRLAKMRAKKKPAEYKNIAASVLAKPDDNKLSFKNVKAWIKETKEAVSSHSSNSRGRGLTPQVKQREMNLADSKKAYIRYMEYYLRTGDWISDFMGPQENEKTTWKCVAMAYNSDGSPKRSVGVFYPDINMVWKQDMIEADYVPVENIAITDKQFTANL